MWTPFTPADIIRFNTGAVNAATTAVMGPGAATTLGDAVMFAFALTNRQGATSDADVIEDYETNAAFSVVGAPYAFGRSVFERAAQTTWTFTGATTGWAWLCFHLRNTVYDSDTAKLAPDRDPDYYSNSVDASGSATTIDTGHPTSSNPIYGDSLLLAVFAARVATGTPPLVTSFANTTTQPGDWTRLGTTIATTNASTPNVRLDVAYKAISEPLIDTYDCTATYATAPGGMSSFISGYRHEWRLPAPDWVGPSAVIV